jgi:hypothetical protein
VSAKECILARPQRPGDDDLPDTTGGSNEAGMLQLAMKLAGTVSMVAGVLAICFGSLWASEALEFVSDTIGEVFEIFVPFLPILLIVSGASLLVRSRR